MMQIKGKSASFRGLTLLLALMLGAGLALTGCGDDDSSPATPAPAPPAPPPAPEPPGTPGNLRVASTGSDFIEFSWDAVEGASGYEIEMSMTEGDFSQAQKATVEGTMHRFTVAAETTGYGRVRAMNDDGASGWSDAVMGTSMAAPLVLGVPMPTVSSTGPDHIEWSWMAVENALAYQVQVADSMEGLEAVSPELITVTTHRVTAEPEMEMYIRVRAGAGTLTSPIVGDWSEAVMGTSAAAPLSAPTLTVSSKGHDHIEFSWEAVEGATSYRIQMSMMEDDFSQAHQADTMETMHRFAVAAETTVYARVRAANEGGPSDWSASVMETTEAAPLVLTAPEPTVSDTGHDFIEWSWDAVEDAEAYEVQVAATMAGLDDAEMERTTETMHRVDAEPEMEMYLRVRAVAGEEMGDWSDAARGMSDVAPIPFMVSMTPPDAGADRACNGQPFCPDTQTDPTKAMAGVNSRMMVTSSHDAQVSPMWIDGAGAAALNMGDNTPFTNLNWNALQSTVAKSGVVFRFQRVTTGAGQEPMAMGDMMYITCGPFECTEAADEVPAAPEITIANSAACTAFEAELTLNVGIGFNGGGHDGGQAMQYAGLAVANPAYEVEGSQNETKRGIDAGWTYTSTSTASVVHEFVGLVGADGGSMKVTGSSLSKTSTPRALGMKPGTGNNAHVNYFGGTSSDANQAGFGPIWNGTEDCFSTSAPDQDGWESVGYSYDNLSGSVGQAGTLQRPNQCFRITTAGRPSRTENVSTRQNFLPGYRVHVTPNASVTWAGSSVNWPKGQDPFDRPDLKCGGVTFDAVDQTDVCGSYRQQVMDYWGRGVGDPNSRNLRNFDFVFEYIVTTDTNETVDTSTAANVTAVNTDRRFRKINIVPNRSVGAKWKADGDDGLRRAPNSVWSSLWLVDARKVSEAQIAADGDLVDVSGLNKSRGRDGTVADYDLYRPSDGSGAYLGAYKSTGGNRDSRVDMGVTATPQGWRPLVSVELIDSDDDPMQGDFGKVDFHTGSHADRGKADNFVATNTDAKACSSADNGSVTDASGGNGACDATASFEETITFTLYQDTNDCTQSIDIDFTCTWDADGDDDRYGDGPGTPSAFGTGNVGNFVTCTQN